MYHTIFAINKHKRRTQKLPQKVDDLGNERIEKALAQDEVEELQYLASINPNLLLKYIDRNNYDIYQSAVQLDALFCLQYLFELAYPRAFRLDADGNSLLHLAAKGGKPKVFSFLMDELFEHLGAQLNKKDEALLELAQQSGNRELLALLYQHQDPRTLDILPCGLSQDSFIEEEGLAVKGLALMLHYYVRKNQNTPELFFVQNQKEDGAALAKLFDLFVNADHDNLLLYYDKGRHRLVYKCEKFQGQAYIFVLDPLSFWSDKKTIFKLMKANYPQSLAKLTFCISETRQQTAEWGCRYYSLKNISLLIKTPCFYAELEAGKYFTKTEKEQDLRLCYFFLPARFMHLTTSPKQLAQYTTNYPEEARKIVRKTKEGVEQNLMEYCLHPRDRYGVKTPRLVKDLNYHPKEEEKEENIPTIPKNHSLEFFRYKYDEVIQSLMDEFSKHALACIITFYDARQLRLDPQTKQIYNQQILRIKSQQKKNTYFFLPRAGGVANRNEGKKSLDPSLAY